jgi:D-psicose/D-tagatose/L-ribulose 3-epimerase
MKIGINLYLWADHMHDGLLPILESLKRIGYDGVEVPIFDLDEAEWARWGNVWTILVSSGLPTR